MPDNYERAEWARAACEAYRDKCFRKGAPIAPEMIQDLVSDLGHLASQELDMEFDAIIELFSSGIGSFTAELDDEDPYENIPVTITIDQPAEEFQHYQSCRECLCQMRCNAYGYCRDCARD